MNQYEESIQNEIAWTEENLNIALPEINKEYQLTSNGRGFYIYEFNFFSVGYDRFPNEIISTTRFLQNNVGLNYYAAIGTDGVGGYFLLKMDKSNKIYFWNGGEIVVYAEDSEKFFEAFEYLNDWINVYVQQQQEINPKYDTLDDTTFGAKLDAEYSKVMKYINKEISELK